MEHAAPRPPRTRIVPALALVLGLTAAGFAVQPAFAKDALVDKFDLTVSSAALLADEEVEADGRRRHRAESQDLNIVYTTEIEDQSLSMRYTIDNGDGTTTTYEAGTALTGDLDVDPLVEEIGVEWWLDTDPTHCAEEASASFICGTLAGDVRNVVRVEVYANETLAHADLPRL